MKRASHLGGFFNETVCNVHLMGSSALPGSNFSRRISFAAGLRGTTIACDAMEQE